MNTLIIGHTGRGMDFGSKLFLIKAFTIEYIIKNRLNNNNWLKLHGKPMVRKGHPFHKKAKKLKGMKDFEIICRNPQEELLKEKVFKIILEDKHGM